MRWDQQMAWLHKHGLVDADGELTAAGERLAEDRFYGAGERDDDPGATGFGYEPDPYPDGWLI